MGQIRKLILKWDQIESGWKTGKTLKIYYTRIIVEPWEPMPFTRHLNQIYIFNWWWGTSSLGTVHETTFKKINEIDDSNTNHARNEHISHFFIFILSNILEQNQDYHG